MKPICMVIGFILVAFFAVLISAQTWDPIGGMSKEPIVLRNLSPPLASAEQAILTAETQSQFDLRPINSTEGAKTGISRGFSRVGIIQRE